MFLSPFWSNKKHINKGKLKTATIHTYNTTKHLLYTIGVTCSYELQMAITTDCYGFKWPSVQVAEWLARRPLTKGGPGSIPGWGSDPGAVSEKGFVPV